MKNSKQEHGYWVNRRVFMALGAFVALGVKSSFAMVRGLFEKRPKMVVEVIQPEDRKKIQLDKADPKVKADPNVKLRRYRVDEDFVKPVRLSVQKRNDRKVKVSLLFEFAGVEDPNRTVDLRVALIGANRQEIGSMAVAGLKDARISAREPVFTGSLFVQIGPRNTAHPKIDLYEGFVYDDLVSVEVSFVEVRK